MQNLKRIRLTNINNMQVELVDFGARIISIKVPNKHHQLIETTFSDSRDAQILKDAAYKGATCGRVANRISNASYMSGSNRVQLNANDQKNMLHGGVGGFSLRHWTLVQHRKTYREDTAVFELLSVDKDQGFPGNMVSRVTYRLFANNQLDIEFYAQCDALCPINMCNHVYFNMGERSIHDLSLKVEAAHTIEVDKYTIPTGIISQVNSITDLRNARKLGEVLRGRDLDDCYLLPNSSDWANTSSAYEIARLESARNGLALCIATNQLGLQVYTGNHLMPKHAAVALEAQGFPDAVNHSSIQAEWVGPRYPYHRFVRYRFANC